MKNFTIVVVVFLLCVNVIYSQIIVPDKDRPTELGREVFGLGGNLSLGTGLGLSFRHHLASKFSYQISAGIIKDSKTLLYDLGTEFQYDLMRSEFIRFYSGGGFGYYYKGEDKNELKGPLRIAIGIGAETKAKSALHASVNLYFTYFTNGTILPLPQFGIHYYFF